jgi:uncharacterized repeat protein (TIGR03899 family)
MEVRDLVGLSKPLEKLIDAVRVGTGVLYEPVRIRRKATAEADSKIIAARADIKIADIFERAKQRLFTQEVRRQRNIEAIVDEAVDALPPSVSNDPLDPDWLSRFFQECQDVSDDDLRQLWARLLAGEIEEPGSCSRKTLNVLQQMSKRDAERFKLVCSLCWISPEDHFLPHSQDSRAYTVNYGLSYEDVLELESLGLMHAQGNISCTISTEWTLRFQESDYLCIMHGVPGRVDVPSWPLTQSGKELFRVMKVEGNVQSQEAFFGALRDRYLVSLASAWPKGS